jgi:hypothetical protein
VIDGTVAADASTERSSVFRIDWEPGSDRLHGTCHCGAEHDGDDPVLMWQWLLAHPNHEQEEGRS